MTDVYQIPLVDRSGDIAVHGRSGASLTLTFQLADGSPRNVAGLSMFFEIEDALRVSLGSGQTPDARALILTQAQFLLVAGRPRQFAFLDESGTVPEVFWSGNIRLFGYVGQPS